MAISRSKVKIWIVTAGTAASLLDDTVSSSISDLGYIAGEIKSYAKSGGERETESDPHFGGFVDKEKPIGQVEVNFEVTPDLDIADRWDSYAYSLDVLTGVYTMAGSVVDKTVYISAVDGAKPKSWGFNNCNVNMFDFDHNADDNQTGTLKLTFSPTDSDNVSNFMTLATAVTSLPAWTALDNN